MAEGINTGILLFNPVSMVHYRNIRLFDGRIDGYRTRCVLNPKFPWFSGRDKVDYETSYFANNRLRAEVFDKVKAVVVFSAQARLASCYLVQEAALRSIPVIAIEEVYQMMLEQGYVNEYFLPADHLFVGSDYERRKFVDFGVPEEAVEATGCMFAYPQGSPDKVALRAKFGLRKDSRVAVLSLAYQTPSGETLEIRRKLLEFVSVNLPERYELIVKPHPAEQDDDIAAFVKRFAPEAKIADKFTPIGDILSITDILLNRGTSQVVIDALRRKIQVIAVPMGREIFLRGMLDEIIADDANGMRNAFCAVEQKGFDLYKPVFDRYLNISPEDALKRALSRIHEIADKKDTFQAGRRLAEIALFWAWMGYVPQAKRTLERVKDTVGISNLPLDDINRLISCKAGWDEIKRLRLWAPAGYRRWLMQSLWIRSKYATASKLSGEDKEWFREFPPRMNREYFIPAVIMLCWCYLRSGMRAEFESLLVKVYEEYGHLRGIKSLKKIFASADCAAAGLEYWKARIAAEREMFLKNLKWEAGR